MSKYSAAQARSQFATLLRKTEVGKERAIVTLHGKGVAALVPIEDLALLERLEDEMDAKAAKKARDEIKKQGTIPWEMARKSHLK